MPVTFLAHQAPLFPLRRRMEVDGVAFLAGTIAPDLSAATLDTHPYYLLGAPVWHEGHQLSELVAWNLPVALLVAFVVRRCLAADLAPELPPLGGWHLRHLHALSTRRHRWWVVVFSVLGGVLSHLVLDGVTHQDRSGPLAGLLGAPLVSYGGHTLTVGIVAQVAASVLLSAYAFVQFRELALRRWDAVADPPAPRAPRAVRGALVAMSVTAAAVALTQLNRGPKIVAMTWWWLVLGAAVILSLALRVARLAADRRDRAESDPLAVGGRSAT